MATAGVLLLLLFLCATGTTVYAACSVSYETKCEEFGDIATDRSANSWSRLSVVCEGCEKRETLKSGAFAAAANLEEVYVIRKLDGMESGAFKGLSELSTLVFYGNQFEEIKSGWFGDLGGLAKLDLNGNGIERIEVGAFGGSRIKQIILTGNRLTSISRLDLNLPGLTKLLLNNNSLVEIPEYSFHADLEYLDLSNNRFTYFGLNVFDPLKNLKVLILNHNRINSVVAYPGAVSIEKLDLSHNAIRVIEAGALVHFPRLRELQLQYNNLVYLNPKSFPPQSALERLYLAANMLVFIPGEMAGVLHKLKFMSVGGNPWACGCLEVVRNFIRSQGIVQDECDRRFFVDGTRPICFPTGSRRCEGNEWNTIKTYEDSVRQLTSQYNC